MHTRTYTRMCVPANIGAALGLCRCHATRCNHSFTFLLFFACFLPLLVLELIRQQRNMFQGFVVAADVLIASLLTCRATVAVVMVWLIRSGVLLLQTSTGSHNSM